MTDKMTASEKIGQIVVSRGVWAPASEGGIGLAAEVRTAARAADLPITAYLAALVARDRGITLPPAATRAGVAALREAIAEKDAALAEAERRIAILLAGGTLDATE